MPKFLWSAQFYAVLFVATLAAATPATGQVGTEPRVWTDVAVQGRMDADSLWRWTFDSIVGTRDGAGTLDFVTERVLVTRDLTRRSAAGIGYFFGARFPGAGSVREHRFVQQYTFSAGTTWRVTLRSRLEEGFVSGQDALQLRASQQARVTWPLPASARLRGVASEELFVQPGASRLDSNRLFVGVWQPVTARSSVEIGYLNVYRAGGTPLSHVMSVTLVMHR